MPGLIHSDQENLAMQVSTTITRAGTMGFLSDATVAAADTKEGLKAAIRAVKVHNDTENIKLLLIAALDKNPNITDANILALTTVAQLAALTGYSNLSSTAILE